MAVQFQEIIVLLLHIHISVYSMSCADNATSEKLKTLYIQAILYQQSLPVCCVPVFQLQHDSNAIISENCIAVVGEKLPM